MCMRAYAFHLKIMNIQLQNNKREALVKKKKTSSIEMGFGGNVR